MKRIKNNVSTVNIVFLAIFTLLLAYLIYNVTMYSDRWFARPSNPRIQNAEQVDKIIAGQILDRNGTPIVWSEATESDGYKRVYCEDIESIAPLIGMHQSSYGRTGLESFYAKYLYGFNDTAYDKLMQLVSSEKAYGNNVWLTIDIELQSYAYKKMQGHKGAIVIMRADTGEILALVSLPSFNPADDKTVDKDKGNLINRATEGRYPPGSTMKLVTTIAALKHPELIQKEYQCDGKITINGQTIHCYNEKAHGKVGLQEAIAQSCNTTFATIATELGAEIIQQETEELGFNEDFVFSELKVNESQFPKDENLDINRLAMAAIGQDTVLVTPMHLTMIVSSIANNGTMLEPGLVYCVKDDGGRLMKTYQSFKYKADLLSIENIDYLKQSMFEVVNSGTGKKAKMDDIQVYGKTGTAEIQKEKGEKNDAWFVGFTEENDCPLAISVILEEVERGQTGGGVAAPIAKEILKKANTILNN